MLAKRYDPFLALADKNRREILMLLTKEKSTINTLADAFDISRPAVSKHIKVLTDTGFVTVEVKGRERICSLNSAGFEEIRDWISYFEQFWTQQMNALGKLLQEREKPSSK